MAIPTILNPTEGESFLSADVEMIEVSGCDDDTALNGVYTSDGATPPVYSNGAGVTIEHNSSWWEIVVSAVDQFKTSTSTNLVAPLSSATYLGVALTWTKTGGTGPATPTTTQRSPIPLLLTP